MSAAQVTVWASPGCGPCYALKAALDAAGVAYVERNPADAPTADVERWRALGYSTPVVQHAGGEFSGFIPANVRALQDARR